MERNQGPTRPQNLRPQLQKGQLIASVEQLLQMNSFYGDIKQAIVDSEEAGLIVATDQ